MAGVLTTEQLQAIYFWFMELDKNCNYNMLQEDSKRD